MFNLFFQSGVRCRGRAVMLGRDDSSRCRGEVAQQSLFHAVTTVYGRFCVFAMGQLYLTRFSEAVPLRFFIICSQSKPASSLRQL